MSKNENLDKAIQNLMGGLTSGMSKVSKSAASMTNTMTQLAQKLEDSDVVALSGGNKIMKVRTPEGEKKYKQPIGSIIIKDSHGKLLKVLHKGNGDASSGPSVSSYQDSPEAAQYGVAKAGKYTGAGKVSPAKATSPSDHITGEEQTYEHEKYGNIKVKVPEGGKVHETGTGLVVEHPDGKMIDYKGKSGAITVHEFGKKLPKSSTKPAKLASGVEEGPYASPYPGVGTSAATAGPSTIEKVKAADLPPLPEKPTNGEAAIHAFQQAAKIGKPVYMVRPLESATFSVQSKPGIAGKESTIAVHPTGGMYLLGDGPKPKPLKLGGAAKGAETPDAAWLDQLEKITKAAEPEKKSELPKPDKSLTYADPEGQNDPITVKYNDKHDDLYAVAGAHAVFVQHLEDGAGGTLYSKYQTKELTPEETDQLYAGTYKNPNWTHPLQITNDPVHDSVLGAPEQKKAETPKIDNTTPVSELKKLSKAELDKHFNEANISAKKYKEVLGLKDAPETSYNDKVDEAVAKADITHSKGEKLKAAKKAETPEAEKPSQVGKKIDKGTAAGSVSHVKATKVGSNAHGKVWQFTDHKKKGAGEQDLVLYAVPTDKGIVVSVNKDGSDHEAGPFSQMKDAKAWVDANGEHHAPEKKAAAPAAKKAEPKTDPNKEKVLATLKAYAADKTAQSKPEKKTAGSSLSHVKATKTGEMEHGKPVWVFTSHTHDGADIEAHPTADGKYEIHNTETGEIHGPFPQMKAAKEWADKNGTLNSDSGKGVKKSAEKKSEPTQSQADNALAALKDKLAESDSKKPEPLADWEKALLGDDTQTSHEFKYAYNGVQFHSELGDKLLGLEGNIAVVHKDGSVDIYSKNSTTPYHQISADSVKAVGYKPVDFSKVQKFKADAHVVFYKGVAYSATNDDSMLYSKETKAVAVLHPDNSATFYYPNTQDKPKTISGMPLNTLVDKMGYAVVFKSPKTQKPQELLNFHGVKINVPEGVDVYGADLADGPAVAVVSKSFITIVHKNGKKENLKNSLFKDPASAPLTMGYVKLDAKGNPLPQAAGSKPKDYKSTAPNGQKFTATDGDTVLSDSNTTAVIVTHPDGTGTFFMNDGIKSLTSAQTKLFNSTPGMVKIGLDGKSLDSEPKPDNGNVLLSPPMLELDHPKGKFSIPKLTSSQELYEVPNGYVVRNGKLATIYNKNPLDGQTSVKKDIPWGPFALAMNAGNADIKPLDKDGNPLPKKAKLDEPAPKPIDVSAEKPDMTKVNPITGTTDNVVEQVTGAVVKSAYADQFTGKDVKVKKAQPEMGFDGYYVGNFNDPASKGSLEVHKQPNGKWAVFGQDSPDAYAENFKTLADAKQWVSQYGQPDAALIKKATVTKTPYGTDFVWNGKKYHLVPGSKAWETNDGKLVIRNGNTDDKNDVVVHPDGFTTSAYSYTSIKDMNALHTTLATAPNLAFGKYTPSAAAHGGEHTKNLDTYLQDFDPSQKVSYYALRTKLREDVNEDSFFDRSASDIADSYDYFAKVFNARAALSDSDKKKLLGELEFYSRTFRVRAALNDGKEPSADDLTFVSTKSPKTSFLVSSYQKLPTEQANLAGIRDYFITQQALADGVDIAKGNKLDAVKELATKYGVSWAAGMDENSGDAWLRAHYLNIVPIGFDSYAKTANSKIAIAKILSDEKYAKDIEAPKPTGVISGEAIVKSQGFGKVATITPDELAALDSTVGALPKDQQGVAATLIATNLPVYNAFVGAPVDSLSIESVGSMLDQYDGTDDEKINQYANAFLSPSTHEAAIPAVKKLYAAYKDTQNGDNTELENLLNALGESVQKHEVTTKPEGVSDEVWSYVKLAEKHSDVTDGMPDSTQQPLWQGLQVSPAATDNAPEGLSKLYANASSLYDADTAGQIQSAITAMVQSNKYIGTQYTQTYEITSLYSNKKITLHLKPGDTIFKVGNKHFVWNEFSPETSYNVSVHGNFGKINFQGSPKDYYGTAEVLKEVPVNFDAKLVKDKLNLPDNIDDEWVDKFTGSLKKSFGEVLDEAEMDGYSKGDALIAVKGVLDTPDAQKNYPKLVELGVGKIPDGTLAYLFHADSEADYAMAELAAHYGYFNMADKGGDVYAALGLQHGAAYEDFINKGDFSKEAVWDLSANGDWSAWSALATDLGFIPNSPDSAGAVSDKLTGATKYGPNKPSSPQNDELQLSLIKGGGGSLKGAHAKQLWADQNGEKWMTKAFINDANSDMRVEAENAANNIGRLYGFGSPESRLMKLPDQNGKVRLQYVQHLAPAKGDVGYHGTWDEQPTSVVHDIMQTHVLNWVISDHDGHGENFMISPDGSHAFGIDHGQAGRFFGEDKLAVGYHATNPYPTWFDHVYRDMVDGLMPKDKIDALRDTVLRKAAQVSTRNEKQYLQLMEDSVKSRTDYPSKFPNKEAWINAHNERRKNAFDDFAKFYEGLYKKAGYEWEPKTLDDYLPKKVGQAHSEVTPDFVADVKKSGSHGQPLMFAGSEVSDNHMITYTTHAPDGSTTLRSQASLLPGADTLFTAWLKKQTIEKVAGSPVPSSTMSKENQEKFAAAQLPDLPNAHSALVNYAKTVSTHAEDGAYNEGTVSAANTHKNNLQAFYDEVKKQTDADPTKLVSYNGWDFKTAEQQDTWLAQASQMLEQFAMVDNSKAQGVKVSALYKDAMPFEAPAYTPTPNLDTSGKPKVAAQFDLNGKTYQKYSDGNYIEISNGKKVKSTAGDFADAATNGTDSLPEEPKAAQSEDTETVVAVANKVIKVKYQQARSYSGEFTPGTNTIVENNGTVQMTGHEYEIQHGDVVIRYQPRSGSGTAKAQQGLLRIEVSDWDGETSSMQDAIDILRETGLTLDPATEDSLELSYYRQLHAISKRRSGSDSKLLKLRKDGDTITAGADDEIEQWRKAFNSYYGAQTMQEFIDSKSFLPVLGGTSAHESAGSPQYLRPDASVEKYREWSGGHLPVHALQVSGNLTPDEVSYSMALSGALSTEERIRVLGRWQGGMSSSADQGEGSSGYFFFRQGINSGHHQNHVYLEPEYAMALSNYSYSGDKFGKASAKGSSAPFDLKGMAYQGANHNGASNNELMIKKGLPPSAFAFQIVTADTRKKILDKYKELGIDTIGGVPIGEKFVTSDMVTKELIDKVWKRAAEREKARKKKGGAA